MKRKINLQFLLIAGFAILVTLLMTAFVSYELFQQEVFYNLKTYATLLDNVAEFAEEQEIINNIDWAQQRVTVIEEDGSVFFDSNAAAGDMDNHLQRPEVKQAFETGEGYAVRQSETMEKSTFYYAMLLSSGRVLRVSEEADSIYSVFMETFPALGIIAVVLFIICALLSHYMTRKLIEPVEQMAGNLDSLSEIHAYKELVPFIRKIEKQHEDILKSAKIRQEFTANVSHELKTPLTAISGYSELIANGMANSQDITRFATEIHRNSDRLLALINDTIRLSELDVVNQSVVMEPIDLYEIADVCVAMLQVNAGKHDVQIFMHGDHCTVNANKEMMEELAYNLCDNAIRYNNQGGRVDVWVEEKNGSVEFRVKDTGIGIASEEQERIFERFYRVDKSRSKSTGGTGLGLAIVKHIVQQHGASLRVNSEPGKGTEMIVTFPLHNAEA